MLLHFQWIVASWKWWQCHNADASNRYIYLWFIKLDGSLWNSTATATRSICGKEIFFFYLHIEKIVPVDTLTFWFLLYSLAAWQSWNVKLPKLPIFDRGNQGGVSVAILWEQSTFIVCSPCWSLNKISLLMPDTCCVASCDLHIESIAQTCRSILPIQWQKTDGHFVMRKCTKITMLCCVTEPDDI